MICKPTFNIKHIELILKLVSRCNINCSYCYYFYGADTNWQKRPKRISNTTINSTIKLLKKSIYEQGITSIQVDFHGGEPLLYGKESFSQLCNLFLGELSDIVNLSFAIQTNGILIDADWIALFHQYQVSVSVSLDGPPHINDEKRVDHKGRGTYERVVTGIGLLQQATSQGKIPQISNLAVINPHASGKQVYRHFVDRLNIRHMDFLLPGFDYDTYQAEDILLYGDFLIDILNEWINDNDPTIKIRLFGAFIAKLYGESTFMFPSNQFESKKAIALTIDSDGMMYGDDSLRSNQAWNHYKALSVCEYGFNDFLAQEYHWHQKNIKTPDACKHCMWMTVCGGGHLENRYSSKNGYYNPSIYCESLQRMYHQLLSFLIDHGVTLPHLDSHPQKLSNLSIPTTVGIHM